mmetsp:Transcript_11398/g.11412  ORF Transcript_11398/g.11412 Transcript_11398/m.11412 type:complete len:108 (+) Transcript_11398:48-371(+)
MSDSFILFISEKWFIQGGFVLVHGIIYAVVVNVPSFNPWRLLLLRFFKQCFILSYFLLNFWELGGEHSLLDWIQIKLNFSIHMFKNQIHCMFPQSVDDSNQISYYTD